MKPPNYANDGINLQYTGDILFPETPA